MYFQTTYYRHVAGGFSGLSALKTALPPGTGRRGAQAVGGAPGTPGTPILRPMHPTRPVPLFKFMIKACHPFEKWPGTGP